MNLTKYILITLIIITCSISSAAEYTESIDTCREQLTADVQSTTAELQQLYSDVLNEPFIFNQLNRLSFYQRILI